MPSLRDLWLPQNYAVHGRATDALYAWFIWITVAVGVGVHFFLLRWLIKFRRGPGVSPLPLHGNTFLEVLWTVIPILVLATLGVASDKVWNGYRNSPDLENPRRTKILVIGETFKWNVIYPGPDGKFGRYLIYPKSTDRLWPREPDGTPFKFAGVDGPADLPADKADDAIADYVSQHNPLGKDFTDPDGLDDDTGTPGRTIYMPANRPVEIDIESKDVIHDFYVPAFRAQLYAVPGMRGRLLITPTTTTAEIEASTRRTATVDELPSWKLSDWVIDIDDHTPGAVKDRTGYRYADPASKAKIKPSIIRDQGQLTVAALKKLKTAGVGSITVHQSMPFEVACAQLCGNLHYTMRGEIRVLPADEFDRKFPSDAHLSH